MEAVNGALLGPEREGGWVGLPDTTAILTEYRALNGPYPRMNHKKLQAELQPGLKAAGLVTELALSIQLVPATPDRTSWVSFHRSRSVFRDLS
jgi:hypothetical protein